MSTADPVSDLMTALYRRDQSRVDELLAARPQLNLYECAALGRHEDIPADAQVSRRSADGFTALHLACFFGHVDTARALLDLKAEVNAVASHPSAVRPIHSAAAARSTEIVALLLERGAEPNATQHGGWTALHAAARHAEVAMVRVLLEHGADPDKAADDGQTARTMAEGDSELQELFSA